MEMAQWWTGHAFSARLILGRMAGIDEAKLFQLAQDQPETITRSFQTPETK
jgi:hypothetical protein